MVAYFHSETVLCMKHTFPPDGDGRFFRRHRGGERGRLCCGKLHRFAGLLVKGANHTSRTTGGDIRFRLSSTRCVQVLISLKMRASDLKIQINMMQNTAMQMILFHEILSTKLTHVEEFFRVFWWI